MGACCETKGRIEGGSSSHISIHEQKAIRLLYEQHNQGQVFTFFNKLEFSDQQNLMKEAISVDLSLINQLFAEYCEPPPTTKSSSFLNVSTSLNTSNPQNNQVSKPKVPALTLTYKKQEPVQLIDPLKPDIFGFKDQLTSDTKTQMIELGQEMIRDGMVAVIVLAGGQGTRLGFDRSKGEYPVNTPSLKTIFQILLEKFLKAQMNAHNSSEVTDSIQNCKFIVMTNPMNHEETVQFFEFNRYFGVRRDSVIFFEQPILPLINFDGKIIMDEPNKIALAPNGNGAIYDAINNNFRVKEIINSVDYVQIVQCDNLN